VANQPVVLGGGLWISTIFVKGARCRFCDCFKHSPDTFEDVQAFLTARSRNMAVIIRHGAKLFVSVRRSHRAENYWVNHPQSLSGSALLRYGRRRANPHRCNFAGRSRDCGDVGPEARGGHRYKRELRPAPEADRAALATRKKITRVSQPLWRIPCGRRARIIDAASNLPERARPQSSLRCGAIETKRDNNPKQEARQQPLL